MAGLLQLTENVWCFDGPARVGVLRLNDTEVSLIDAGGDKEAGKRILKALTAAGWTLKSIFVTHAHADHIGGCAYLQRQTGCRVYAVGRERDGACHPLWEASLLFGGDPPEALRHKFTMAQPCDCEMLTEAVLPEGVSIVPLPGHAPDMVGLRTAEDVVFLADCVCSRETLEKYRVSYTYDIGESLRTLEAVQGMSARLFVPAHAPVTDSIAALAQLNIEAMQQTADDVARLCGGGKGFDGLMQALFDAYGMSMNPIQHALIGSTLKGYLRYLEAQGRVTADFVDNVMVWRQL